MSANLITRKENDVKNYKLIVSSYLVFVLLLLVILGNISSVTALPVGPVVIYNSTSNATLHPAAAITTYGGSFTTLLLNTTGQTYRWKAYVGNITGKLTLADATNKSVFDWAITSVTGEVYATRSNSAIDWSTISCADGSLINSEDVFMNMSLTSPDTINKTFNNTVHKSFYVGSNLIANSTCRSVATYINGTSQSLSENALFQEILLKDVSSNLIYTTLVNSSNLGYNNDRYDFQMILAENEYHVNPTTYYLYVELI
ncbi:MAG: hypothetical protein ACP5N1_04070 [Candidatus Woesearchaeota archaeon]